MNLAVLGDHAFYHGARPSLATLLLAGCIAPTAERPPAPEMLECGLEEKEVAAADNAKSLPGTRGALEELRYRGLRMAVLSRNCRPAVDHCLERLDLGTFFETVITREDAPPKPLADGVELIIGALGGGPAVMVGDSTLDILAGRNAGITTIGVLSGYASHEDLEVAGADHIIDDVSQLPALLVRLKGR